MRRCPGSYVQHLLCMHCCECSQGLAGARLLQRRRPPAQERARQRLRGRQQAELPGLARCGRAFLALGPVCRARRRWLHSTAARIHSLRPGAHGCDTTPLNRI